MTAILQTKGLSIQFGGIKAVTDLNLQVEDKSITALIGPNGAGKTTVFNLLTGVYAPTFGDIFFEGTSLKGLNPHDITRLGLARTFQNIRLFKNLSVIDNVRVGLDIRNRYGVWRSLLCTPAFFRQEQDGAGQARRFLRIFELEKRADELAGNLCYGDQRRLEIARALATGAKLLLLDEPAAGLNGHETAELMKLIVRVRQDFGLSVLLIEHDMKLVMGISDKVVVLDYGRKIAEDAPQKVAADPVVIEAYLGRAPEAV